MFVFTCMYLRACVFSPTADAKLCFCLDASNPAISFLLFAPQLPKAFSSRAAALGAVQICQTLAISCVSLPYVTLSLSLALFCFSVSRFLL